MGVSENPGPRIDVGSSVEAFLRFRVLNIQEADDILQFRAIPEVFKRRREVELKRHGSESWIGVSLLRRIPA